MASIKFYLDTRSGTSGKYKIMARISHSGTNAYINTGEYVEQLYFDGNPECPIRLDKKNSSRYRETNMRLIAIVKRFNDVKTDMSTRGLLGSVTATTIKQAMDITTEDGRGVKVFSLFEQYADRSRKETTKSCVVQSARVFRIFLQENGYNTNIGIADITKPMLMGYTRWLGEKYAPNTHKSHMRMLRSVWKYAVAMDMYEGRDPFVGLPTIYTPEEEIESLTVEQLRELLRIDSKYKMINASVYAAEASFLLAGMNLRDIYDLPKPNGTVKFVRAKIDRLLPRPVMLPIGDELTRLIEHEGGRNRMFRWGEQECLFKSYQRSINKGFDMIYKRHGIHCNLAIIRRTFASLALECGVQFFVADCAMGHKAGNIMLKHYGKITDAMIEDGVKKVIRYVYEGM